MVIVNVSGPGLGGIQPSTIDYNQITRGGGMVTIAISYTGKFTKHDIIKGAFDI